MFDAKVRMEIRVFKRKANIIEVKLNITITSDIIIMSIDIYI